MGLNTIECGTYDERPSARDAAAYVVVAPPATAGLYLSNGTTWALVGGGQPDIPFSNPGAAVVGTGAARYPIARPGQITGVVATAATAPTGAALIFDVNKNGTTIFTTQANRPTILAGTHQTVAPAVPDVTTVATNDYLVPDIDQVGSSVAGSDIVVVVLLGPLS